MNEIFESTKLFGKSPKYFHYLCVKRKILSDHLRKGIFVEFLIVNIFFMYIICTLFAFRRFEVIEWSLFNVFIYGTANLGLYLYFQIQCKGSLPYNFLSWYCFSYELYPFENEFLKFQSIIFIFRFEFDIVFLT